MLVIYQSSKNKLIQSDRCNKKTEKTVFARVYATWYAGVLACDLNTNLTNHTNVFFLYRLHELHGFFWTRINTDYFFSTDYTNYTDYFCLWIYTNLVTFLQNYGYTLLFNDYPQTAQIWNRVSSRRWDGYDLQPPRLLSVCLGLLRLSLSEASL